MPRRRRSPAGLRLATSAAAGNLRKKTRNSLRRLLILLEASWLSPFGAELRYPGDRPEMLPGDEVRALDLARKVRDAVMAALAPFLA